jgi:hypothetical protein
MNPSIVSEQDAAYQASLEADEEREIARLLQQILDEEMKEQRFLDSVFAVKKELPPEPTTGLFIKLSIAGVKIQRRFKRDDTLENVRDVIDYYIQDHQQGLQGFDESLENCEIEAPVWSLVDPLNTRKEYISTGRACQSGSLSELNLMNTNLMVVIE